MQHEHASKQTSTVNLNVTINLQIQENNTANNVYTTETLTPTHIMTQL